MLLSILIFTLSSQFSPTFNYRPAPPDARHRTTPSPTNDPKENCGIDLLDIPEKADLFKSGDARRWKWVVRLMVHSKDGVDYKKSLCNGVLLDELNILTSTNCLFHEEKDNYKLDFVEVMFNVYNGNEESDEQRRWKYLLVNSSMIISHPNYNEETREFDVAIINLPRALQMKQIRRASDREEDEMTLKPICFTKNYQSEEVDESNCRIIGWEFKKSSKECEQIEVLKEAEVSVFNDQTCRRWFKDDDDFDGKRYQNATMLCYGHKQPHPESVYRGECLGNSGSPIQCWGRRRGRWMLAGVASWNGGCGSEWQPSVATRLAKCYSWIKNNMKVVLQKSEKPDEDDEPLRGVDGPTPTTRQPEIEIDEDPGFNVRRKSHHKFGRVPYKHIRNDDLDLYSHMSQIKKETKKSQHDNGNNHLSISGNVNRFGLRLLQELSDGKDNVFQSPFSIAAAMTMLMVGTNGNTFEEIKKTFGYEKDTETIKQEWQLVFKTLNQSDGQNVLAVANKMIVRSDVEVTDGYKKDLKWFDAEIDLNQNDIVEKTNEWVKEKTRGVIPEMLKDMGDIAAVLLNAIFFQGVWQEKFEKENTDEEGTFYNYGKTKTKVAMMNNKFNTKFNQQKDFGGFKILELPYKQPQDSSGPKISMVILLPNSYTGLQNLVNQLSIDKLNEFRKDLDKTQVEVFLPRFKLQTEYNKLREQLMKFGINDVFNEAKADLSGITPGNLYVSDVIHKAAIEVDEKGTKAAAATAVVMVARSDDAEPDQPEEFCADHPFLYFIVDDTTGIILFAGTINNL